MQKEKSVGGRVMDFMRRKSTGQPGDDDDDDFAVRRKRLTGRPGDDDDDDFAVRRAVTISYCPTGVDANTSTGYYNFNIDGNS
jgi:hypothetical protein